MLPEYEVFALRYAKHDRFRRDNFMAGGDLHDAPMPLDYFVWLIRGGGGAWLVDAGFSAQMARQRERHFLRCPIRSLAALQVAPEQVRDVIITHLHYDHAGNLDLLPNARIHLQERELQYATGCHMCKQVFRFAFAVEDVVQVVRAVYADRVAFCHGETTIAPGIETHLIGGHTDGLQVVRVHTRRGWVVLASDASHYYENMERQAPYPIVFHVGDMVAGWDRIARLADSPRHIVPGHDPDVLRRYPPLVGVPRELQGEIVCLHEEPSR
ncbi:N-acyl homoserine lactonase family protein [Ramlibacter henchirensis]|uniref:N-acyl homoserine lactonase family protein n=1 Tax=Ramlibacter henchirensis TaxID=204072 RepID=A0A4Z0C6E4_9BURK|nr:N-acyl homoserine lactonase family protein [Ramlibacter henchirensis]TFZ05669.1 N-acyl homoserine lactonase family protein [Ramlibacter henchirensis]